MAGGLLTAAGSVAVWLGLLLPFSLLPLLFTRAVVTTLLEGVGRRSTLGRQSTDDGKDERRWPRPRQTPFFPLIFVLSPPPSSPATARSREQPCG
jgi:hypothetical protein